MTKVCYLGGFGRSGTTLLERMLASATEACALGEVVWVWDRGVLRDERCGCGQPFSACEFWQQVGQLAFGGWDQAQASALEATRASLDRTRHIPSLARKRSRNDRAREYAAHFARIYEAAAKVSGARVLIDSSKHSSTAFVLRLEPRIDLNVVHVVRDSRGVAYSWTKTMARPEAASSGPDALMHKYPPYRAAVLWDAHNLAFALLAAAGVPTHRLRYEHLLRAPQRAVAELAEFLGERAELGRTFIDDRTVQFAPTHQLAGNPMRFSSGPIELREDNAWREAFDRRSRVLVSALTLPLLARYGYLGTEHRSQS